MRNGSPSNAARLLIIAAAFVVVVAGIRAAEPILVPFLLSVFVAIISAPPMFAMVRRGVPTVVALLTVISFIVVAALLLGMFIGSSVDDFSRQMPEYQASLQAKTVVMVAWFEGIGFDLSVSEVSQYFDPGAAMALAAKMLSGFGVVLTNAFLILLTVSFILLEASGFPRKVRAMSSSATQTLAKLEKFTDNVKRYMAIKTAMSLGTGTLVALWLWILGVDYPLLWGMLAFLFNYVPNIGSIIAAVPAVLLALVQLGTGTALLTGIGYLVVNVVIGNVIEPRFMGRGLGLSTLVVFLSLVFWGWILGPVGMLLSVPLTMTLKIALESSDDTRPIAVLLGPDPEPGT